MAEDITNVTILPTGDECHYVSNRPPLLPDPLVKLPLGSVQPRAWLRHQLELMRDGMAGRLGELSKWCRPENSAWMSPTGEGEHPWEELPYWLRGFGDLGYVLGDQRIISEARRWIDAVLTSQRSDGYFGPQANRDSHDVWPNMIMLNVVQSFHEATGDERVLPFMSAYFRWQLDLPRAHLLPGSWQKIRGGDNLESILWLYNRTGEGWLLELAEIVHDRTAPWDREIASWHGVNICQAFREPAEYYLLAHDRRYLDATERNYQMVMTQYGQVPGGMFGADETCRPGHHGPRQAAETCSMVEFMRSFEMLLAFTGDPKWADRCEDVAYNSLPAAMTPDLKALHYLTAPNMVRLDHGSKAPILENSGCMLAFSAHRYRCCQHNAHIGWPGFANHLWFATQDRGLAAAFFAPCALRATVGNGVEVVVIEQTDYPFDDTVTFTFKTPSPVCFPLYLRIPDWCDAVKLAISAPRRAGGFSPRGPSHGAAFSPPAGPRGLKSAARWLRIERSWVQDDQMLVTLPMNVRTTTWHTNADFVSVHRGPLSYSLKIGEDWRPRSGDTTGFAGAGGAEEWPEYEVHPTTPWNYGLVLDDASPASSCRVAKKPGPLPNQPFAPDSAPIELVTTGQRIPGWREDPNGMVGPLQASPVHSEQPSETITLIPMGCARLRISAFPAIGTGPDARPWPDPPPRNYDHALHGQDLYNQNLKPDADSMESR